jgi:hypothetical protein
MGQFPKANTFAFNNDVGTVSPVMEDANRIIVARIESYRPEGTRNFDESFNRASSDLTQKKLMDRAFEKAKTIHDLVASGTSLENAAEENDALYDTTGMISRQGSIMKLGRDPNFLGVAFTLTTDKPLSEAIMTGKGAAVINLLNRQAPNLQGFAAAQDSLQQKLTGSLRQRVYSEWMKKLQDESTVKDYRDEIYGTF